MKGPIRPDEVVAAQRAALPDFVFEAFNSLISINWDGSEAKIEQEELIRRLLSFSDVKSREEIYQNGWLNVEPIYRKAGWLVSYYKPCIGEAFNPYFVFRKNEAAGIRAD